ncbi:hypothetical protein QYE76_042354 [Lolium multiflorum]|uniref:Retrotransposon gag domain-containing protein n=1 Tax=Lolium multiflorum TaxID=4521 RepID=A0AAD8TH39_LOLMU|nr:hypothetical protein QYE76_042354 [Lolium multiflorum]
MGPSASPTGVFIRTGLTITTGEQVASGLIWRFGSLDCVSDNAGCFADRPFPAGGKVISFGGFDVYDATVAPPRYPRQILRCASPPPGAGASLSTASPCVMQEVMASGDDAGDKTTRVRGPQLERTAAAGASGSGPKAPAPPSRLDEVRAKLSSPLTAGADPSAIEADLETHRQLLLKQAEELSAQAPDGDHPARVQPRSRPHARRRQPKPSRPDSPRRRRLGAEIARDGAESPAPSAEQPVYNTPDKNMRAAQAAAEELNRLEGEELRAGRTCCSTRPPCSRPTLGTPMLPELLMLVALQAMTGTARGTRPSSPSQRRAGTETPGPPMRVPAEQAGRPAATAAAAGLHQAGTRRKTPRGRRQDARTGPRGQWSPPAGPLPAGPTHRAGRRQRPTGLVESRIAEEEGPAGPKCFGPRILNEPMVDGFQLPCDTPNDHGQPDDWLLDYSTAVGIAKGNKRWAVRYSMLLGSARTWLNNLPAGSINGWLDFEEAFINNFTGTYRRPGHPQQLEMCKQGPDETDRAYLTRWCEMRNSCEGVHEIQAISFFMGGCRPNTMLWHKLRCSKPKTMAALMAIADYALAEEAGKAPAEAAPAPSRRDNNKPAEHKPAEGGSHGSRRDNYRGKRHSDQPDRRYGSAHVAAVSDHAAAGGSRR